MRRILAAAAIAAASFGGFGGTANAVCAGTVLCAVDGCTGLVNVCPTADECRGTVNVCVTADDCYGGVNVCGIRK